MGRKKDLSVTNVQSVEAMATIRHNVTLSDYLYLTDFNSQNVLPLNSESRFDYDNKAPAIEKIKVPIVSGKILAESDLKQSASFK